MGPTEPICIRPIVIRATRRPLWTELAEMWEFRELLVSFVARELRIRYAQTWVGVAWVVLKPVVTVALLYAIFGVAANLPTDGMPGPVFFFAGLMLWFFFSGAITDSKDSLVANADLIRKVYFPRPLLPLAIVVARLIDLGIMLVCLAVLLVALGDATWPSPLGLLWVIVTISLLAAAVGFVAAAVNVRYRDATHVVPVALQLLMFASPIVYSSRLVPAQWSWAYTLNPLVGLIDGFRAALMGGAADPRSVVITTATTVVLLMAATMTFRRLGASFADHV